MVGRFLRHGVEPRSELTMGQWVMGHGSHGLINMG